jgi:hypothetical protein
MGSRLRVPEGSLVRVGRAEQLACDRPIRALPLYLYLTDIKAQNQANQVFFRQTALSEKREDAAAPIFLDVKRAIKNTPARLCLVLRSNTWGCIVRFLTMRTMAAEPNRIGPRSRSLMPFFPLGPVVGAARSEELRKSR